MKLKDLLTTLFGEKCKTMKEFSKFLIHHETRLQGYPEQHQMKVLVHKFPDSALHEVVQSEPT